MLKTFDEMCDDESICDYCDMIQGVFGTPNGYISCEGSGCVKAYEDYLEELNGTENLVKYQNTVKLINKGVIN